MKSCEEHDLRDLLACLLSPAMNLSGLMAYCLQYQHPLTQESDRICGQIDTDINFDLSIFVALEETVPLSSFKTPIVGPLGLCGRTDAAGYVYSFTLSQCQVGERLLVVTSVQLTRPEQQQLMTVSKAVANHLKVWQAQRMQQAQASQLKHLLGSVEHQVRQSLGLAGLYLSLLEGQPLDDQGRVATDNLRSTVADIAERLTAILEMPKAFPNKLELIDIRKIVGDRVHAFNALLQEKHLVLHMPEESAWIQGTPHQFGQIVDNLLCNAISYSPNEGMIEFTWDVFDGEVLFQIRDQGPGIPSSEVPKIFQPGYTRRENGHGLGLSIVQKLVQAMGGRIWVNNLLQGGAQFSVIFPQSSLPQYPPAQF